MASTVDRIAQRVILVESAKKRALLLELLAAPDMARTLIFTRTKRGADRVAKYLEAGGVGTAVIHGDKRQRQREEALNAFRNAKVRVLVATDIAARGIDIDQVSHIVNYELPDVPEAYVHRIGRTARAGAAGEAISLCDGTERDRLRAIERLTRQTIPTQDRRNDAKLAADKVSESARPNRRPGGRPGGHSSPGAGERPRFETRNRRDASPAPRRTQRQPAARA